MSTHRDLRSSCSLISFEAKKRENLFLEKFSQSFPNKTLFVTLLSSSLMPEFATGNIPDGQKNIYVLVDIKGTDHGKFLDSETAFSSAIENGYVPRWAH